MKGEAMKTFVRILAVVVLLVAAHGTARAQTKSWSVTTGDWSAADSWSPSGLPGTTDDVSITNGGTATLNTNATIRTLSLGSANVLQKDNSVTARSITLNSTDGLVTNAGTIRYGQGSTGRFTITSGSPGWNNSGLITADVAGAELRLTMSNINDVDLVNSGTLQASGGTLNFAGSSRFDLVNTGGVVRAINNGTVVFGGAGGRVTGGSVSVEAGSTLRHQRTNDRTEFTGVTVTNAGRMFTEQTAGNQSMAINFLGNSTLTNSGTLEYLTSGTLASTASGTVASTATVTNEATGIIRVANNNTAGTATAFFSNSTANFTNQGGIEILSNAALATGSSQFRSTSVNFSNAGSFLVDGPVSSIEMATQTFTQSAGSLSLVNGGTMTAGSVLINGGTLLGTGTIAAPTTIGGILAPGSGGIGTLSVSNDVTWNAGNAWLFELGTAADSLIEAETGSTADVLSLTGGFTKGSGTTFTFNFASTGEDGWYKLVDYGSTTFTTGPNTQFAATGLPTGKSANFVVDSATTALYVQIVPEPATLALSGIGLGMAALSLRSLRRRA
jgi:hypothetical protein